MFNVELGLKDCKKQKANATLNIHTLKHLRMILQIFFLVKLYCLYFDLFTRAHVFSTSIKVGKKFR